MTDAVRLARGGLWSSLASLVTSTTTLVCCALPALLVSLGAGAALASLVSVLPQLVWLSERKGALFTVSAAALAAAGWLLWRNHGAPCPIDPLQRIACTRIRRTSGRLYLASVAAYLVGGWFAFARPLLH